MSDWGLIEAASDSFIHPDPVKLQNQALDELTRHDQFQQTKRHPEGFESLRWSDAGKKLAHKPEATSLWAREALHGVGHPLHEAVQVRAQEYHDALRGVAADPLGLHPNGGYNYQHLENAHNNLRVELQQRGHFAVPSVHELSPVNNEAERAAHLDPDSWLVNPRHDPGTGDVYPGQSHLTEAANAAHQVNCQRSTLAAEARHRGYNVEAAPNFQTGGSSKLNSQDFNDHGIASWFRHPNGTIPAWTDTIDKFPHVPNGPEQWDAMTGDIASWGPHARGAVTITYPDELGNPLRHIFNAHVGGDGTVQYHDAQKGRSGDVFREMTGYTAFGTADHAAKMRGLARGNPIMINRHHSPLRYLRTDDKTLSAETSKHMIDRGTADHNEIDGPPGVWTHT